MRAVTPTKTLVAVLNENHNSDLWFSFGIVVKAGLQAAVLIENLYFIEPG